MPRYLRHGRASNRHSDCERLTRPSILCVRNTHAVRFTRAAQNLTSMLATLSRKGRGRLAARSSHQLRGEWSLGEPPQAARVDEPGEGGLSMRKSLGSDKIVTAVRIK